MDDTGTKPQPEINVDTENAHTIIKHVAKLPERIKRPRPSELIKPSVAVTILTPVLGTPAGARGYIADAIREGRLTVFSRRRWTSHQRSMTAAWKEESSNKKSAKVKPIPTSIWRRNADWAKDQGNWKWDTSRFHVTYLDGARVERVMLTHVRLRKSAVFELRDSLRKAIKGRGGGKDPDPRKWSEVFTRIIDIVGDRKRFDEILTKAKFRESILSYESRLEPEGTIIPSFDAETIAEVSDFVWNRIYAPAIQTLAERSAAARLLKASGAAAEG